MKYKLIRYDKATKQRTDIQRFATLDEAKRAIRVIYNYLLCGRDVMPYWSAFGEETGILTYDFEIWVDLA